MTITNNTKLRAEDMYVDFLEVVALETVAEVGVSCQFEAIIGPSVSNDWTFGEAAESNGGEVATVPFGSVSLDLDESDGLTYSGPSGIAVRVVMTGCDIVEGTIAAEAADDYAVALCGDDVYRPRLRRDPHTP